MLSKIIKILSYLNPLLLILNHNWKFFADDVKCTHGGTVGQLDEDGVFYLQSRGIPEPKARQLMIHAFAGEVY